MKTIIQIVCIILLLLNGIGAFYGGLQLIADPSGAKLQLPLSYLDHSPFYDYLIPGIVLIVVNGVFSFVTLGTLLFKHVHSHWFLIIQGLLLTGWIVFQILFLRMFYPPLHATFLSLGIVLLVCGFIQKKYSGIDANKPFKSSSYENNR